MPQTSVRPCLLGVFQFIDGAVKADAKRADRIRLLNFSFLEENLAETAVRVPVLAEYVDLAREARTDASRTYVSKTCDKQFGPVLELALHMATALESGVGLGRNCSKLFFDSRFSALDATSEA